MRGEITLIPSLNKIFCECSRRLQLTCVEKRTLQTYRLMVIKLNDFMIENSLDIYSCDVGELFLETPSIKKVKSKCFNAFIAKLNSIISQEVFWPFDFQLNNYKIQNSFLLSLCVDFDLFMNALGIRKRTQSDINRTIKLLDLYLHENELSQYSPEVGRSFLNELSQRHMAKQYFDFIYVKTIERVDSYFYGVPPFWKIYEDHQKYVFVHHELQEILAETINRLTQRDYGSCIVRYLYSTIIRLDHFMTIKNIEHYSVEVGEEYIHWMSLRVDRHNKKRDVYEISYFMHFNDTFKNLPFTRYHKKTKSVCPNGFRKSFDAFIEYCKEKGNKTTTIRLHTLVLFRFFQSLIAHGCVDLNGINADVIILVCNHQRSFHHNYSINLNSRV